VVVLVLVLVLDVLEGRRGATLDAGSGAIEL